MAAIVSSNFRVLNAENFKTNIANSSVYVGIGKSDVWSLTTSDTTDTTPFTPNDHLDDIGEARFNLIGLKKVVSSDIAHVIPRKTWTSGRSYVPWDSDDGSIFDKDFYIITSEFKVYKCIKAGGGASSIQPTQTLTDPTAESDGYVWKYMFTTSVADANKFLTNSYMPVKTVPMDTSAEVAAAVSSSTTVVLTEANPDILVGMTVSGTGISGTPTVSAVSGGTLTLSAAQSIAANVILSFTFATNSAAEAVLSEADYAQFLNQKASKASATAQGIERIEVTAPGASYSSAPTVVITGDGTGASATAVMAGSGTSQTVSSITVNNKGSGYTVIDIELSGGGGSGATARGVLAPAGGHGTDPRGELGGFFISLNSKLDGNDGSDLTVGNDFRQIMLIKDPENFGTSTPASATTLKAMKYLDFASSVNVNNYQIDELLTGGTSGAKAYVVEIDSSNGYIYYHQNSKTGYGIFQNGETITGGTSTTSGALESSSAVGNPEVDRNSGEVLFLENRAPINRSATQIEDIKVILEF